MLKTILGNKSDDPSDLSGQWFGIDAIAGIGVTSEADEAPVKSVLDPDKKRGGAPETRVYR